MFVIPFNFISTDVAARRFTNRGCDRSVGMMCRLAKRNELVGDARWQRFETHTPLDYMIYPTLMCALRTLNRIVSYPIVWSGLCYLAKVC